jgi:hypothetical protein
LGDIAAQMGYIREVSHQSRTGFKIILQEAHELILLIRNPVDVFAGGHDG